ncbi:CD3324 family protein [Alkalihalobacillus sp. CinArs1]|uniref:CD3324 family protein n=1 Tax=Alkalihalobacillus sp. CinArs1 TaxID=2995314 RepID=UPI0022DE64B1|nr:CD3324 family protein [Alkalihalobacillus sp. CinArs1]
MKYVNAEKALPNELLKEIQKYIQGETLYIPKPQRNREKWGASTGIRSELSKRNRSIKEEYLHGHSVETIAEKHHLSVETIKKIIYSKKKVT